RTPPLSAASRDGTSSRSRVHSRTTGWSIPRGGGERRGSTTRPGRGRGARPRGLPCRRRGRPPRGIAPGRVATRPGARGREAEEGASGGGGSSISILAKALHLTPENSRARFGRLSRGYARSRKKVRLLQLPHEVL